MEALLPVREGSWHRMEPAAPAVGTSVELAPDPGTLFCLTTTDVDVDRHHRPADLNVGLGGGWSCAASRPSASAVANAFIRRVFTL